MNEKNEQMNNNIIEIAKSILADYEVSLNDFKISNLEGTNASIITPKENQRGIGGFIIDEDGSYLICGSIYPLEHYIEEFKNGKRD